MKAKTRGQNVQKVFKVRTNQPHRKLRNKVTTRKSSARLGGPRRVQSTKLLISKRLLTYYRKIYLKKKFAWQVIGVTGSSSLEYREIKEMAETAGAFVADQDVWQQEQIIVVGRENFDELYLKKSVEVGLAFGFTCVYLAQEAFINLLEHDWYPLYYKGDPRIIGHPGLSFLASIGFKWPSIEERIRQSDLDSWVHYSSTGQPTTWNEYHPLREIYGYSVRQGVSEKQRHNSLRQAIRADALGLRAVAEHIAWLIDINRLRRDDRMEGAIDRWEADLDWLRKTYYENSIQRFVWPSI